MALLRDLSMGEIVARIAAALIYAGLQGFFLAGIAWLMGDRRPAYEGRFNANPFAQLSVWGVFIAALFAFSWIRPMRFDPKQNRFGRWGLVLVVLLGMAALVAVVPVLDLARQWALLMPRTAGYTVLFIIAQLQLIIVGSVLLNLLPLPGLIMGTVLVAIWPAEEKRSKRWEPITLALIIAAIVAGLIPNWAPAILPFVRLI